MDLNFRQAQNRSDHPLGGRYQVVEKLGVGGFGHTFRAQDLHLPGHPLCVVKQLKPQLDDAQGLQVARRLFDTEARVLYELSSHPQIPHLLAHFEENTAQTPKSIEFLGQNTYVYSDGSMQKEERTFQVQLVDGQPRIVDSAFVRVTQSR